MALITGPSSSGDGSVPFCVLELYRILNTWFHTSMDSYHSLSPSSSSDGSILRSSLFSNLDAFDNDLDLPPDKRFDEECLGEPKPFRKLVD